MVRLKFLLIVTATSIALLYPTEVAFAGARTIACTAIAGALYACPDPPETGGKANGGSVDVTADTTTGSSGTGTSSHPRRGRGGTDTLAPPRVCANGDPAKPGIDTIPCGNGSFLPFARPNTPTTPCTVCSPSTIVSVSDLQNFPAYAAPTNMEPNGWTIVGLPTNFWAAPSAQIQEGLLLGQPAHVMFTPIGYHWDYGDSNTTSTHKRLELEQPQPRRILQHHHQPHVRHKRHLHRQPHHRLPRRLQLRRPRLAARRRHRHRAVSPLHRYSRERINRARRPRLQHQPPRTRLLTDTTTTRSTSRDSPQLRVRARRGDNVPASNHRYRYLAHNPTDKTLPCSAFQLYPHG